MKQYNYYTEWYHIYYSNHTNRWFIQDADGEFYEEVNPNNALRILNQYNSK